MFRRIYSLVQISVKFWGHTYIWIFINPKKKKKTFVTQWFCLITLSLQVQVQIQVQIQVRTWCWLSSWQSCQALPSLSQCSGSGAATQSSGSRLCTNASSAFELCTPAFSLYFIGSTVKGFWICALLYAVFGRVWKKEFCWPLCIQGPHNCIIKMCINAQYHGHPVVPKYISNCFAVMDPGGYICSKGWPHDHGPPIGNGHGNFFFTAYLR